MLDKCLLLNQVEGVSNNNRGEHRFISSIAIRDIGVRIFSYALPLYIKTLVVEKERIDEGLKNQIEESRVAKPSHKVTKMENKGEK